jgi:putative DNA primase/helicase
MADKYYDECMYLRVNELTNGSIQFTDSTNAERFIKEFGGDIRYNKAWKKWVVWNGKFWETDESGALVHEKGLLMVRNIYREILKTDDHKERLEIENFAKLSESIRRRENFVKAAQYVPSLNITSDDLDPDPWLMNVQNGTINIITGELTGHRQGNMITKIANVNYDPSADCPLWKQFIREIMDYKPELVQFVQTAAGWTMTGDISEQVMFILYGTGANGKSTFLNTSQHILGDYSTSTNTETFMKKNGDQYTNDVARLRGTRFVTTTEAEQGRRLSEPLIKKIAGNEKLTARFLYGEYFTFLPTFKIWMATNHKPIIKGTDHGIWRRIMLIPFTTTIPKEKQDRHLEAKLKREASGILNWLLEGAARWREEKLQAPDIVLNATDEYRGEMDVIGIFLKERCRIDIQLQIRIRELYKAYADWCDENKEHAVSERFFSSRLKEMGYEQKRNSEARFWSGLGLKG